MPSRENNIIKENCCCALVSLLDSIAGWVGVIDCRCCSVRLKEMFCALVSYCRITGDSEDYTHFSSPRLVSHLQGIPHPVSKRLSLIIWETSNIFFVLHFFFKIYLFILNFCHVLYVSECRSFLFCLGMSSVGWFFNQIQCKFSQVMLTEMDPPVLF